MVKTYHVAKAAQNGKITFILGSEKVSENIFNELVELKLKELVGPERMDQYEDLKKQLYEALEEGKPVNIGDRNFEIKTKKEKKK
jgi:hypothetical protein